MRRFGSEGDGGGGGSNGERRDELTNPGTNVSRNFLALSNRFESLLESLLGLDNVRE
jgi:hypothetical protein